MIIKYLSPAGLSKLISKMKAAFSEKNHNHQLSDLSGTVPVNKGGTGATAAAQARTNLGVTPQNIGAMPTGGGTFSGNITVSKTDPYVSLENTGTNNKFGFHVYGDEAGKGVLALYDQTKAKHVFGIYSHSERVVYEWPVDLLSALAIESGGTGANNAAGARNNLSVPELRSGVVIVGNQKGIGTGVSAGQYWQLWNLQNGSTYPAGLVPSENGTQYLGQNGYRIKAVYANDYPCGTWNGNAIAVAKGGTGATDAAGARANLDITPANIGAASASHNHSAGNITSGVIPIVRGGTGASDAAGARANLGITPGNIGALSKSGDTAAGNIIVGTDTNDEFIGFIAKRVSSGDGAVYKTQVACGATGSGKISFMTNANTVLNEMELGKTQTTFTKPVAVASGGTGATSAAGARANLGIGVADTASGSITYNSAGQQVNFGKTLSKVPIVICIQNGGDFANYKVGNITRTGFTISASATGTTWQYVALCV